MTDLINSFLQFAFLASCESYDRADNSESYSQSKEIGMVSRHQMSIGGVKGVKQWQDQHSTSAKATSGTMANM